jgi:hypothetical protein
MAMEGRGIFKLVGTIFTLVGLILLGVAGWTGNRQYTILKTWPSVEAEVVKSEVISYRDSEGDVMYKAAIDFRYTVDGKEYTVPSSSSYSSSSYSSMRSKVNAYAPGTRHPIRCNPSDPGDMRFDVGYNFGFFFVPFLLGVMGIVFTAFGVGSLYAARSVKPRLCPSCGQPVEKGQSFCPGCSAPLPSQ